MLELTRNTLRAVATAIALAAATPGFAQGPALVTVTGAVANPNREAVDAEADKLFARDEVTLDPAMEFDRAALEALPQTAVSTDFPMGGATHDYTGPLLADVLAAAGAEGETVTVQALDGYAVEAPVSEMTGMGAVLALSRDGTPLGIGGLGPAQLVFPRTDRAELAEMTDDWWIWQIYHIRVE